MIKDKLCNAKTYYGISENLKKGFEWLKSQDLDSIKPDKYYIDSEKFYANIQEYETKEDALYESHKKYIDIQCVIKGKERVGVCGKSECQISVPYDEEKDIDFMQGPETEEFLSLSEGEFLVLFPNDAHKPSINPSINTKNLVKKVVVKVPVD